MTLDYGITASNRFLIEGHLVCDFYVEREHNRSQERSIIFRYYDGEKLKMNSYAFGAAIPYYNMISRQLREIY